jgi:hypothetical protein
VDSSEWGRACQGLSWILLRGSIQSGVDENLEMIKEYTKFRKYDYDYSSTAIVNAAIDGFNFNR